MEQKNIDYQNLKDEELAALAKYADNYAQELLLARYKNFVKKIVHPYFIIGADREDLIQEGMIGLYKAIGDYSKDKETSFASFANTCIKNQILSAIRNASRKKHSPLNTYISMDSEDNSDILFKTDHSHDPEKILIFRESKKSIENLVTTSLTRLETDILIHFLKGLSYAEIAEKLNKTPKSVDNALSRLRRKISKLI